MLWLKLDSMKLKMIGWIVWDALIWVHRDVTFHNNKFGVLYCHDCK